MLRKKTEPQATDEAIIDLDEYLRLPCPPIPMLLENVILVFAKNIPEDSRKYCSLKNPQTTYPEDGNEGDIRRHIVRFVRERLDMISLREYILWLNGRLPFITPRELLLWRLRQYVEYIWAFQLPDDDDLGMIFNTTKMKAAHISADFIARFRKALLFPIALRRLYRILRGEDENYRIIDTEFEYKKAYGSTLKIPSSRYVQDANALIDEFRLRVNEYLRDAELISKEDNIMWVDERVIELAKDDSLLRELLTLYQVPRESGYEG